MHVDILLGSTFSPNWMDWPMLYTGNPYVIEAMFLYAHDFNGLR